MPLWKWRTSSAATVRLIARLMPATLAELCRVLKVGGRLVCLDLTPPRGPMRRFFAAYIAAFVPLLGVVVAGNYDAYRYLFDSLSLHPNADRVTALMREAGFAEARYRLTGFGTVALHRAVGEDRRCGPVAPQFFRVTLAWKFQQDPCLHDTPMSCRYASPAHQGPSRM